MRKGTQLHEAEMGRGCNANQIYGLIDISLHLQDSKLLFFLGQEMGFIFCCPKRTSLMKSIDGHFER